MICAIHQPNFFPWLGYFDKIKRADKFIILDDVQYQKTGGSWSNRVPICINKKKQFYTAPITRPSGLRRVNEVEFIADKWRDRFIKTLQASYAKAPFFLHHKEFIFDLIANPENNISKYNIHAIESLCDFFHIDTPKTTSSKFNFKTDSNQLLIDLVKAHNCTTYMAGGGADSYQHPQLFKDNNITLLSQNFEHPQYPQIKTETFIEGFSIIDYIFNVGNKSW